MNAFRNARQNFHRQAEHTDQADLERQQSREAQEMHEPQARPSPISGVLRRFADLPRMSGRQPRPTSSRYSGGDASEIVSPKTPQFAGSMPGLQRMDTLQGGGGGGANGPVPQRLSQPPSYDDANRTTSGGGRAGAGVGVGQDDVLAMPARTVAAQHVRSRSGGSTASSDSSERRQRRRFDGADPAELHLADMAEDGRRRRRRRTGQQDELQQVRSQSSSAPAKRRPKKFLFCFPYVKSHKMRAQILRCSVSGLLMALLLTMYLSLMLTHNIRNNEFSVLLLLIALSLIVLFCHSLVRIVLMIMRPPTAEEEERYRQRRARAAGGALPGTGSSSGPFPYRADLFTPGGYAIPQQPIRVVLARDEEAAGVESVAAKTQPPAYGLWRETVIKRVDPNRIYWQRNDEVPPRTAGEENSNSNSNRGSSSRSISSGRRSSAGHSISDGSANDASSRDSSRDSRRESSGAGAARPPSYASEDGVRYVVDAQPRSIAPTTEVPILPHPAEEGRRGEPARW